MGPDSPAMTAKARTDCRPVASGFAYSCDVRMDLGAGPQAMHYRGEFVVGYDAGAKAFRAFTVFNDGTAVPMEGTLKGKKLTLASTTEFLEMGEWRRGRITFDFTDPTNVRFVEEHKVKEGDWEVASDTVMKPAPTGRARRGPPMQ